MARAIESTPTMQGIDAVNFKKNLISSINKMINTQKDNSLEKKNKEKKELYERFNKITNGIF